MEGGTRIVVIVVLVLLIIGGLVLVLNHLGVVSSGPTPPPHVLARIVRKIDKDTFEVMDLSLGQWRKLGYNKEGKYKNPKTGKYTMVPSMTCAHCGKDIPVPELPATGPEGGPEDPMVYEEMMRNYRCPLCGQLAMPSPDMSEMPMPPGGVAPRPVQPGGAPPRPAPPVRR